jgi:hypothetical protein
MALDLTGEGLGRPVAGLQFAERRQARNVLARPRRHRSQGKPSQENGDRQAPTPCPMHGSMHGHQQQPPQAPTLPEPGESGRTPPEESRRRSQSFSRFGLLNSPMLRRPVSLGALLLLPLVGQLPLAIGLMSLFSYLTDQRYHQELERKGLRAPARA